MSDSDSTKSKDAPILCVRCNQPARDPRHDLKDYDCEYHDGMLYHHRMVYDDKGFSEGFTEGAKRALRQKRERNYHDDCDSTTDTFRCPKHGEVAQQWTACTQCGWAPEPSTVATLADKQAACTYNHSRIVCHKCGFYNDVEARKNRAEVCERAWLDDHPAGPSDKDSFRGGFEAGYAYANDMLKAFLRTDGASDTMNPNDSTITSNGRLKKTRYCKCGHGRRTHYSWGPCQSCSCKQFDAKVTTNA